MPESLFEADIRKNVVIQRLNDTLSFLTWADKQNETIYMYVIENTYV
jgi:hypothetical protein